jgi:hypothetical protein
MNKNGTKNTMEIWIVSGRIGTDVLFPRVFKTYEEAEQEVKDFIYESARRDYQYDEEPEENPSWEMLEEWADNNGFEFEYYEDRGVYYGGYEYCEAAITKHTIEI